MEESNTPTQHSPTVGLIYAGSIGSFFWLDLLYGVAIAIGIPNLIIALMS